MRVAVAWKECGDHQIEKQLKSRRAQRAYREIITLTDGILSPTSKLPPRPDQISDEDFRSKGLLLPTPYPLEYCDWDFSVPESERSGIMIGTREFGAQSRNHLEAIKRLGRLAKDLKIPRITVINSEKKSGAHKLQKLGEAYLDGVFQIIEKPLPYPDYMKLLASHCLVYQMDHSNVPGQVAGDCVLARTLCVGGNSTLEQVAFPDLSDDGSRSEVDIASLLETLLHDKKTYTSMLEQSQQIAHEKLSFTAIARELANWKALK